MHVKAKIKALRLMYLVQVLKDPDKISSVLAKRWVFIKMRDCFFITPSTPVAFVLNVKGFYKDVLMDSKILLDKGKDWIQDATTAKLYTETLKQFKRQPKVELKDFHIQYNFIWSEFELYPLDLDAKDTWFKLLHQALTVRALMYKLRIISTPICALCKTNVESVEHLFIECADIQSFKSYVLSWFMVKSDFDSEDLLHPSFYGSSSGMRNALLLSEYIFAIWVIRRDVIFQKEPFTSAGLKALFDSRLKWRLKADVKRLNEDKFRQIWGEDKSSLSTKIRSF